MNRRLGVVVALLVAGGAAGVLLSSGNRPASPPVVPASDTAPPCLPLHTRVKAPSWFPRDLPLPADSYVNDVLPRTSGVDGAVFTVPRTLDGFVKYATTAWKRRGWTLVSGESEPGEAEGLFAKGGRRNARFIAREVYCEPDHVWVLVQTAKAAPR